MALSTSRLGGRLRDLWVAQPLTLLVVAVVVPSACVLWFMNEAIRSQTAATERSMADLYRSQLRSVGGRVGAEWEARAASLETRLTGNAQVDFQQFVAARTADAVVLIGNDGRPRYPSLAASLGDDWTGAHWWPGGWSDQATVQDLVRRNKRAEAIAALEKYLGQPRSPLDAVAGRSVAADAHLLLLSLLPTADPKRGPVVEKLTTLVNDYERTSLPAAQRTFLMAELEAQGVSRSSMPTFEAERLALAFLESHPPVAASGGLRPTALPDVWQLPSATGKVVALYRTEMVSRINLAVVGAEVTSNVTFLSIAPGGATDDEAVLIGGALPGWSMTFVGQDVAVASQRALLQRNVYLTIALLTIGLVAAVVGIVAGGVRRQAQLAALKTDLVSTVSHELKTPLASMRLLVDSLLQDAELDHSKTRDYLGLMAGENERLTRLVENFLIFAKLERRQYRFAFAPTSAEDIVRQALAAMPAARRSAQPPRVTIEPALPEVVADRDALVTVLLNLLDNAYKYSPPDATVDVRVFGERRFLVFAVQDQGIGMPASELRRIFKRFYRIDTAQASRPPGTGLGLSIVQGIVRAHGGQVRVQSGARHGSTFEVTIPAAGSEA